MGRRVNTIIIVPHNKAKFFKFSFSTRTAVFAGILAMGLVLFSIVALVYTGTGLARRNEVQNLIRQNKSLKTVNDRLSKTITQVQARLDEFEERTKRLALVAGMETTGNALAPAGSQGVLGRGGPYDRVPDSPAQIKLQSAWIEQHLNSVERVMKKRARMLACTPSIAPTMGVITDGFGRRKDPFTGLRAFHRGLDIAARRGTPVEAPADGIVIFAGHEHGYGRVIRLSHGFGYSTVFGHLSKILVRPGEKVRRGQVIGRVGSSGRSTGPHLHYEVHVDGKAVNPLYYILNAF